MFTCLFFILIIITNDFVIVSYNCHILYYWNLFVPNFSRFVDIVLAKYLYTHTGDRNFGSFVYVTFQSPTKCLKLPYSLNMNNWRPIQRKM